MNYIKWAESKIINFKWYDIGLIKLSVLAFAFLIAKLCPEVLRLHWGFYLTAGLVFALPVYCKMLKS
jgi:hypothetical protein